MGDGARVVELKAAGRLVERVGVPAAVLWWVLSSITPRIDNLVTASNYATWTLREMRAEHCDGGLASQVGPEPETSTPTVTFTTRW